MDYSIVQLIAEAQFDFDLEVKPRDEFEVAVVNALGEISWNEAVEAIRKHRIELTNANSRGSVSE